MSLIKCLNFKFLNIKWKKKAKPRPKNNVKHKVGLREKMNTRFEKQKMSSENEKKMNPPPMITK